MISKQVTKNMKTEKLVKIALWLSLITILYNVIEGMLSIAFGINDETLTLLGFGVDSFVEVISGIGILHMILRMQKAGIDNIGTRDKFERQALKITGIAFYLLTLGLVTGVVLQVLNKTVPETTLAGIIISSISIITMFILMKAKMNIGKKLNSDAIIADARCTKTCFYLSFILLFSSVLYEIVGIMWFDTLGSIGIAWFAFKEGKEAFEKSNSASLSCHCCND